MRALGVCFLVFMLLFSCSNKKKETDSANALKVMEKDLDNANTIFTNRLKVLYEELKKNPMDKKVYNNIGDFYFKNGFVKNAKMFFYLALKIDSNYVPALFNLSVVYNYTGRYDSTIYCLERIHKIEPDNIKALTNLSRFYYKKANLQKALEYATLAYNKNPDDSNLCYNIGKIYEALKEYDLAKEYYEKAIELNKNNKKAEVSLKMLIHKLDNRNTK